MFGLPVVSPKATSVIPFSDPPLREYAWIHGPGCLGPFPTQMFTNCNSSQRTLHVYTLMSHDHTFELPNMYTGVVVFWIFQLHSDDI